MRRFILSLAVLVSLTILAYAQSENDLLRSLNRADRNLNQI